MDTPLPIPNREVKHFNGENSVSEDSKLPVFFLCSKIFTFFNNYDLINITYIGGFMKINEDTILDDAEKIFSLTESPSFSKNTKFKRDINSINLIYSRVYGKYFRPIDTDNPYYDRLYARKDNQDMLEYCFLVSRFKDFHLELADTADRIINDNYLHTIRHTYRKTYNDNEIREMLLDFFNEEGQYKFVKSLFDEERIGIAELNDLSYEALCMKFLSDLKPYILVNSKTEKLNLLQIKYLAHEIGHAIEGLYNTSRNKKNYYDNKSLVLREVASKFYDIEFSRYLERNRINIGDTKVLINNNNMGFLTSLKKVKLDFSNKVKDNNGNSYTPVDDEFYVLENKNIGRICINDKTDEQVYIELDFFNPLIYGLGGYIGLYLTELKRQDPNYFNRIWNDYLSMRTLMDYEDIIDMFGLNSEAFLSGKIVEPIIKNDFYACHKELKRQL